MQFLINLEFVYCTNVLHLLKRPSNTQKAKCFCVWSATITAFYFMFGWAISSAIEFKTKAIMKQSKTVIIFNYAQNDFALKCIWRNCDQNNPPIFISALNHQYNQENVNVYYVKYHQPVGQLANLIFLLKVQFTLHHFVEDQLKIAFFCNSVFVKKLGEIFSKSN